MLLSAHFFSGVTVFAVASTFNVVPRSCLWFSIIVILSIAPDFDMLLSRLHRDKFTHTPIFWGTIVALITVSIGWSTWILIPTVLLHLILDTLDYGLMVLYPFSRKRFGLALLCRDYVRDSNSLASFLREYLSNRKLVVAELGMMIISLLLLLGTGPFIL